jgi:opacity protein-like surface antigen
MAVSGLSYCDLTLFAGRSGRGHVAPLPQFIGANPELSDLIATIILCVCSAPRGALATNKKDMIMRKLLLAAAATVAIAAPATARDGSGYVGIEGGALFPKSQSVNGTVDFTTVGTPGPVDFGPSSVAKVKYKTGYDVDLIGGYDFGMFRLEGELGYKRAKAKSLRFNDAFVTAVNTGAGATFTTDTSFGLDTHTSVLSGMVNALADFGGNSGVGGYIGAGAGYANVKQFGDSSG